MLGRHRCLHDCGDRRHQGRGAHRVAASGALVCDCDEALPFNFAGAEQADDDHAFARAESLWGDFLGTGHCASLPQTGANLSLHNSTCKLGCELRPVMACILFLLKNTVACVSILRQQDNGRLITAGGVLKDKREAPR